VGRARSGLAHGNGVHKAISEEPSRDLRGARLPVCAQSGLIACCGHRTRAGSGTLGRTITGGRTEVCASSVCGHDPPASPCASFFRPASIWQASEPLPTQGRGFTHRDESTEDDAPAHDGCRVTGVLSGAEQAQWEEDGWCLVRGLLPPETITAAQAVLPTLVPTAEEFADNEDPARNEPFRVDSHRVMPRFPFEDGALNDIVVHDRIIDLAEQLLGLTDTDLRLYQAMLSAKYGEGALSDEQLLHVDFGNHTLVVPRHEPGYQQLEMFVYLSDVTAETGATRVVSRRLTPDIQVERTYLSQTDYAALYAAEVPASGPAGSILAYRPDVYHRGVRMTQPRSARFMVHVSYKPAATDWLGSHGLPSAAEDMSWYRFVQHADERQLTVLGFPPPGHPYWTAQTLTGVAARYPMLDLSPWRDAAAGNVGAGA
jgi:hypothetical protein